ncbi:MAG: DNA processing protein DprA [Firmicutes bacterium]|nr:DNA processing protein DprA [Bacillota bacterium]
MERRHFYAALSQVAGVRHGEIAHLNIPSGGMYAASDFAGVGLNLPVAQAAAKALREFDVARWEQSLQLANCRAIAIGDPLYPSALLDLYAPPLLLYYRGSIGCHPRVAVVGTRRATFYGRQVVETFVPLLVSAGHSIVSGLALGIDTYAHQATLKLGGHTIAVLGSGLDYTYPQANKFLAESIVDHGGALCSEYAPGSPPLRHHFPARNRLISALAKACLVVEGDLTSGALITATHALEQGREVLAVPGSIFSPQSRGTNYLISQGAVPLTDPAILLATLGINSLHTIVTDNTKGSPEANLVLSTLGASALTADDLVVAIGRNISSVLATLSELEIAGVISRLPTGQYICHNPRVSRK